MADGEVARVSAVSDPADEVTKSENVGDGDTIAGDKVSAEDEGEIEETTANEEDVDVKEENTSAFDEHVPEEGGSEHDVQDAKDSARSASQTEESSFTVHGEKSISTTDDLSLLRDSRTVSSQAKSELQMFKEEVSYIFKDDTSMEISDVGILYRHDLVVPTYHRKSIDKYPYQLPEEHDYSYAQMEEVEITEPVEPNKRLLTPIFLDLMCRKNKDKTKHLILRGTLLMDNLKRRLCDNDLANLREYLKENKQVVSLDLAYNNITSDGLILHLIPLLQENIYLKEVVLSNNTICIEGLEALSQVSSQLHLTALRLNGNKLGPKSGEAMARLLNDFKTLKYLDISETDQNVSSLSCIAAILRTDYTPCSVERYPFFRPRFIDEDSMKKELTICSPSKLALYVRQLVARQNEKEDDDSALTLTPSEKSIIMCPDSIDWTLPLKNIKLKRFTENSLPILSKISNLSTKKNSEEAIKDSKSCKCQPFVSEQNSSAEVNLEVESSATRRKVVLEVLFLDRILGHYHYQPLTYHFTRILSDLIKANNSLKELHLSKNSLTDSDIQVLSEGLKENTTLRLLDLSANHIGCLGVSYITGCLSRKNLEALILNHNDISDHGARCLFFNLPSTNIKMLDLAHNCISDAGMMDLLYAMRKQPKLLALFIWGNPITRLTLNKVKEYLVQGWLLTDSLDIRLYEVDDVLHHAWNPSADPYKKSYYITPPSQPPAAPPQNFGLPLHFQHYDPLYQRQVSRFLPKTFLYSPSDCNSCTI